MKTITRTIHVADDGSEHSSMTQAVSRDMLTRQVAKAMKPLGKQPARMSNGDWVQHDPHSFRRAHRAIVKLLIPFVKDDKDLLKACRETPDKVHPMGCMMRYVNEMVGGPLEDAWGRLMCINADSGKEGNQPFFALNPEKLDGDCVEDRR